MQSSLFTILLATVVFDHVLMQPADPISLLQCQSKSEDSKEVFLPNIPDEIFDHESISDLRINESAELIPVDDMTFVFDLPPVPAERSCSGTIIAIEFCYQIESINLEDRTNSFNYLTLSRNGQQYTVIDRLRVRTTPSQSICVNSTAPDSEDFLVCCDRESRREFMMTPSEYSFAILTRNAQMLTFSNSASEYNLEHARIALRGSGNRNSTFTVSESDRFTNKSLPLVRFILEPDDPPTHVITTTTSDDNPLQTPGNVSNIPDTTNSITSTKKNTIIITALSGIVAFSAILVIILLVVVVLMVIKNAKQTKAANVKLHTTPSCIPLTRQETQDSACCSIRTGTNSYI